MTTSTATAADGEYAERQGIQVIARAAAILRTLEKYPDGLTLGEIAKLVALPRSTVQRIVDALDREGLVIAASNLAGVRLGPALIALAAATKFQFADLARPTLEALARATGETVDLALVDDDKVVFIDQVSGNHRLIAVSAVGRAFPLHCSANGKAILAAMADTDLARIRKRLRLTPQTRHTITAWQPLERELEIIRKTGVAFDREENSEGISAVAIALRSRSGELAAISIPVPTQRFAATEARLVTTLLDLGRTLQQQLSS